MRSAPPRLAAAQTSRWADEEDEEEEEWEEEEGFYREGDECLHRPRVLWQKKWSEHDPDAEVENFGGEARDRPPEAVFSTAVTDEQPWTPNMTPGVRNKVVKTLMNIPISSDGIERKGIIGAYSDRRTTGDGKVEYLVSDEYTYLTRRIAAQRDRNICIWYENEMHWFECSPMDPGDICDIMVIHRCDSEQTPQETLPLMKISRETTDWWSDAWGKKYGGDTGGSEKRENTTNFIVMHAVILLMGSSRTGSSLPHQRRRLKFKRL